MPSASGVPITIKEYKTALLRLGVHLPAGQAKLEVYERLFQAATARGDQNLAPNSGVAPSPPQKPARSANTSSRRAPLQRNTIRCDTSVQPTQQELPASEEVAEQLPLEVADTGCSPILQPEKRPRPSAARPFQKAVLCALLAITALGALVPVAVRMVATMSERAREGPEGEAAMLETRMSIEIEEGGEAVVSVGPTLGSVWLKVEEEGEEEGEVEREVEREEEVVATEQEVVAAEEEEAEAVEFD